MIGCPNCGGGLRFDIPSQQVMCDFCNTSFAPHEFDAKDKDGIEQKEIDVTTFTCPQCGGEVYSTDETAASFCSFCGASTILFTQLCKQKKPDYIIPFRYTKDQCKQAYSKMMKKAIFAPKELKDASYIDSFRGIYMPYWSYNFSNKGTTYATGGKSHREGDYVIEDKYSLSGELDCFYNGIAYDASSSFSDNLSETLAPFNTQNMEPFSPAYLCGFYADTADVDEAVYSGDAEKFAAEKTGEAFKHAKEFSGIVMDTSNMNSTTLHTQKDGVDYAMFPVWFLSYRNRDRVAYATVNGQTGKVVADIPIDTKKYLVSSFLLAIPFFIVLLLASSVISITPTALLVWVSIFALIAGIIYVKNIGKIDTRDSYSDDRGYLYKTAPKTSNPANAINYEKQKQAEAKKGSKLPFATFLIIVYAVLIVLTGILMFTAGITWSGFFLGVVAVGAMITTSVGKSALEKVQNRPSMKGIVFASISFIIGILVTLSKQPYDLLYYVVAILILISVFTVLKDIINAYNILSTRQLPQFDHKGGDDRA